MVCVAIGNSEPATTSTASATTATTTTTAAYHDQHRMTSSFPYHKPSPILSPSLTPTNGTVPRLQKIQTDHFTFSPPGGSSDHFPSYRVAPQLLSALHTTQHAAPEQTSVKLPPISSFDHLVQAAQKQYPQSLPGIITHSTNTTSNNNIQLYPNDETSYVLKNQSNYKGALSPISITPPSSSASSVTLPSLYVDTTTNKALNIHADATKKKVGKPRKKKQCPICHNYYANLSTHKSTHLMPENRPYKCPVCNHGFARNNDLIRHKKRHWKDEFNADAENATQIDHLKTLHSIKGTFKCPYNEPLINLDMKIYPEKAAAHLDFETSNCHPSGMFSRCDTFKNHLKALHFEYPPGTKKRNRLVVPGRCKHCGTKFDNVEVWLKTHVGKECGYNYH